MLLSTVFSTVLTALFLLFLAGAWGFGLVEGNMRDRKLDRKVHVLVSLLVIAFILADLLVGIISSSQLIWLIAKGFNVAGCCSLVAIHFRVGYKRMGYVSVALVVAQVIGFLVILSRAVT